MPAPDPPARPRLAPGDHAPLFACPDSDGKIFELYSAVNGRPLVMIFAGDRPLGELSAAGLDPTAFDRKSAQVATFVPGDADAAKAQKDAAGWQGRVMCDPGGEVTQGMGQMTAVPSPAVYILDPNQRLLAAARLDDLGAGAGAWIAAEAAKAAFEPAAGGPLSRVAPVLAVPRALEPEDCKWLIGLWHTGETDEGTVAMGATRGGGVSVVPTTKRREDFYARDPDLQNKIAERLMPRLVPEIEKNLHFDGYFLETFKIGCYKAEKAGFFDAHRDDYSPATKGRRFAVTVNLNTGEYEGGNLRFPEYGPELYCPPRGGAIVFSCSALHEVTPVTKGERFVLLTFLTVPIQGGGQ
ncbi:MAG: 2OG-Fe(II) oxygenase [Rhodospirillaceae bacterium]